jgi:hypothetical protein
LEQRLYKIHFLKDTIKYYSYDIKVITNHEIIFYVKHDKKYNDDWSLKNIMTIKKYNDDWSLKKIMTIERDQLEKTLVIIDNYSYILYTLNPSKLLKLKNKFLGKIMNKLELHNSNLNKQKTLINNKIINVKKLLN